MKYLIMIGLALCLLPPMTATAQDDRYPECTLAPTRDILSEQLAAVQTWADMEAFHADFGASLAFCQGLVFEGNGDQVVGPVAIPAGVYTLTLSGDGSVEGEIVSGDCDSLFAYIDSNSTETQEVFRSNGCSLLLALDSRASWLLEFIPLETLIEAPASTTASTTGDGSQPADGVLAYGNAIEGVLLANATAEYRFQGTTGDRVTIGAVRTGGGADLLLELYLPSGGLLFRDDDSHPEGFLNPYMTGIPLSETGEYRIVVTRCGFCDAADTAVFTLSLTKE